MLSLLSTCQGDAVLTDADLTDFDDSPIPGTPWKPADILADVDLTTIQ